MEFQWGSFFTFLIILILCCGMTDNMLFHIWGHSFPEYISINIKPTANITKGKRVMFRKSVALLLLLSFLASWPLTAAAEDAVPEKEGYILDFSTEFNGGSLNTEYWLPAYLPHCTASMEGSAALCPAFFTLFR